MGSDMEKSSRLVPDAPRGGENIFGERGLEIWGGANGAEPMGQNSSLKPDPLPKKSDPRPPALPGLSTDGVPGRDGSRRSMTLDFNPPTHEVG